MFRSATTRIAHNSIVPGLAVVNKDLKALQDLINAEKTVLQSLQKLSVDLAKASEALKIWGNGEGDDLGDTLAASSALLLHYCSALTRFAGHEATVREQMKAVRTREENLDDMKRRRKAHVSKADSADKKLNKMSSENKNFQSQADSLNKLREEIRMLDADILNEESSLQDFKRQSAKNWMGVKYGALMECCEKGAIVSELGKLVISEIPLHPCEPGMPRPYYSGHANTDALVMEASRRIQEVQFSTEPNSSTLGVRQLPGPELPLIPVNSSRSSDPSVMTYEPSINNNRYSQSIASTPGPGYIGLPELGSSTPGLGMTPILEGEGAPSQPRSPPPASNPFNDVYGQQTTSSEVGEFGVYSATQYAPRSTSLRNLGGDPPLSPTASRGPRFATFPVKSALGPRPQPQSPTTSFLPPQKLEERAPSIEIERPLDSSFSDSIAQALGPQWSPSQQPPEEYRGRDSDTPSMRKAQEASMHVRNREYSPPPPMYTPTTYSDLPDAAPQQPRPGSATPGASTSGHRHSTAKEEEDDTALAYLSDDRPPSSHSERPSSSRSHGDRRVTFGGTQDDSQPPTHVPPPHPPHPPHQENGTHPPQATDTSTPASQAPPTSPRPASSTAPPPPSQQSQSPPSDVPRIPPPRASEDDEKALNAAAAREVSRELDALMFNSPIKQPEPPKPPSPPLEPLHPSQAAFARRPPPARMSFGGEPPASPVYSLRNEPSYIRERDRASLSPTSDTYGASQSSIPAPTSTPPTDTSPLQPPPAITDPAPSPAPSSLSLGTPYRTPNEFPLPTTQPAGPGSFYNLPALSNSGTFSPGGTRTISAAAFKRQIRSPSSPPPSEPHADASPLNVRKRVPGSPLIPGSGPGLRPADAPGTPRVFSAPNPGAGAPLGASASRPLSANGDDDEYDYISAYVDDSPPRKPGAGGHEQGNFATNLEHNNGIR